MSWNIHRCNSLLAKIIYRFMLQKSKGVLTFIYHIIQTYVTTQVTLDFTLSEINLKRAAAVWSQENVIFRIQNISEIQSWMVDAREGWDREVELFWWCSFCPARGNSRDLLPTMWVTTLQNNARRWLYGRLMPLKLKLVKKDQCHLFTRFVGHWVYNIYITL